MKTPPDDEADDDDLASAKRHLHTSIGAILFDMRHPLSPATKRERAINRGSANSISATLSDDYELNRIAMAVLAKWWSPAVAHTMSRDPVIAACVTAAGLQIALRSGLRVDERSALHLAAELRVLADKARIAVDRGKGRAGAVASVLVRRAKREKDKLSTLIEQVVSEAQQAGEKVSGAILVKRVRAAIHRSRMNEDIGDDALRQRIYRQLKKAFTN